MRGVRHALSAPARNRRATSLRAEPQPLATIGGMKILNLIHVMVAQAFYQWALREIDPLHPDVPRIMLRQQELADKARRIFA
jgi:hypothetical protein